MPGRRGDLEEFAEAVIKGHADIEAMGLSYSAACAAHNSFREAVVKSVKSGTYELDLYGNPDFYKVHKQVDEADLWPMAAKHAHQTISDAVLKAVSAETYEIVFDEAGYKK